MQATRLILLGAALLALPFSSGPVRADVVTGWNALALDCIRNDNSSPTLSSRNLAILHTAIYDAVNSITRTHQPYRFQVGTPTNASPEAAVVAAAYEIITALYPSFDAWADDLYDEWLASVTNTADVINGFALGSQVGLLTLDSRDYDGSSTDVPYVPSNVPGQWQRTPPFFRPPLAPQWGYVDTFCLPDIEPFVPGPPPALNSPEYAAALNEVKAVGGKTSVVRTAEQSQIAVFWSDFSYTAMPPGHWHEIAVTIAQSQTNTLEQNARLFALISLAQADAAIVCWNTKYRYNLWRPITAIRRAHEDGNAATDRDPAWDHYLNSPPFPAYTSGHSTFSKASAEVLTAFYGRDTITFTATSDSLPGIFRGFTSLAACANEIGLSRIYGGIHYSFDNAAGKECGAMIGRYVSRNFLLPNDRLPQVVLESVNQGHCQLRVHGHLGANCVVETSSDLTGWESVSTNQAVVGGLVIEATAPSGETSRFFRVREELGQNP